MRREGDLAEAGRRDRGQEDKSPVHFGRIISFMLLLQSRIEISVKIFAVKDHIRG